MRLIIYIFVNLIFISNFTNSVLSKVTDNYNTDKPTLLSANIIKTNKIKFIFNKKAHSKILKIDDFEILIAFKDITISKKFKIDNIENPFIKKLSLNYLPDNVAGFTVKTKNKISKTGSKWAKDNLSFELKLFYIKKSAKRKIKKQTNKQDKKKILPKKEPELISKKKFMPVKKQTKSIYNGNINDILIEFRKDDCINLFSSSIKKIKQEAWENAFTMLKEYIDKNHDPAAPCLEKAYYLKAYTYYKLTKNSDMDNMKIKAEDMLMEASSYFPESLYYPYALACIGLIKTDLENNDSAMGYFNIILNKYKNYKGTPQILFNQSTLYLKNKKYKKAVNTYNKIIKNYPYSEYITDSKIGIAKVMYHKNKFKNALKLFNEIIKENHRKQFIHADLLEYMGNCYYQLSKFKEARNKLSLAYNLFPKKIKGDIILTRIGDTYRYSRNIEKSKNIYQFVIDNFKGTDGYIVSLMRLADSIKDPVAKNKIYDEIFENYPDHDMVNLASFKKAQLFFNSGEYEKSISLLFDRFSSFSYSLRQDAKYLLEKSFLNMFHEFKKTDAYPKIIIFYKKYSQQLTMINSAEIYHLAGKAYLDGHLYPNAQKLLEKAYYLYKDNEKKPELYLSLGIALYETNETDKAIKMFYKYITTNGKPVHKVYKHLSLAYLKKRKYKKSIQFLNKAEYYANSDKDKVIIMMNQAKALTALKNYKKSIEVYKKLIKIVLAANDNKITEISTIYNMLAENYLTLKKYDEAANALENAISLSKPDANISDLKFKLAMSYYKDGKTDKARTTYKNVAVSEDLFWGRLAKEKLKEMQIRSRIDKLESKV